VLVFLGLWVRLKIGETPAFRAALESEPPPPVPLGRLLSHHPFALLAGSAGVIACFSIFYLSTAFALSWGTTTLGHSREKFLAVQLAANTFLAIGIVIAAVWADRASSRRVLAWGAAGTLLLGLVFGPGLQSGALFPVFLTLAAALTVMGLVYGPLGAWLPTLFPVPVRYTGVSIAFNAGGMIGGGLAPIAAQLIATDHGINGVGGILLVAGLLSLVGVWLAKPANAAR
jgi:hypothetical protein